MADTPEIGIRMSFARQVGDEAGHFWLVAGRLVDLGLDATAITRPRENPMFDYLRGLSSSVERIAAGLYTLEAMAIGVNENFIALCDREGDAETARIYREHIQPDERTHQEMGRRLLEEHATTPALERAARETVGKLLDIAAAARTATASKLGTACFPGC
jgi:hypothetical protein